MVRAMETSLIVTVWEEVLLESSGQRPGMLPNMLQCSGQPPQPRILQSRMSMVLMLRSPELKEVYSLTSSPWSLLEDELMRHFWQRNQELVWNVPEQRCSPLFTELGSGLPKSSPGDYLRILTPRPHHRTIISGSLGWEPDSRNC